MTGIFLYLKHVADLLDHCYEREALLHANHIHSFAPLLRFDEQFAASPQELAEHRAFLRERQGSYIWPDHDAEAAFIVARDEARQRGQESGQIWEGQLTEFLRRRMKSAVQQSMRLRELLLPYKDERAELFREEVDRFSTALCTEEHWPNEKNTAFCKAVFASQEAATGLRLDRTLSTKASPTYSKVLARDWKVSIHIDGKNLNRPFSGSSMDLQTGEVSYHGPWVDASITIRPVKPSPEERNKRAMLRFPWVFPVPNYYHFMCRSYRAIEATIRICIEMFRLLEPELEAALMKESAERAV